MIITGIEIERLDIPLKKPFKTALRQVTKAECLLIRVTTDTGETGYGGAAPTAVITGDITESITGAIANYIAPSIKGMNIEDFERIMSKLNSSMLKNTSAKAAVDMALYDLYGKHFRMPLYKLFGGKSKIIETDITVSINDPLKMAEDAMEYVTEGYNTLKIKVGIDSTLDLERIKKIRKAIGANIKIRLDANQGWKPKEAVRTIRLLEDMDLGIELVEQPVKAHDLEGLKYVTDNVSTLIMADEAVFSVEDAFNIFKLRAADIVNIKLMKCGGLYNALKINALAESSGVECMIGCMIESKIGIAAAAHLAGGKLNITRADLDAADLMADDPIDGGVTVKGRELLLTDDYGLGIKGIRTVKG